MAALKSARNLQLAWILPSSKAIALKIRATSSARVTAPMLVVPTSWAPLIAQLSLSARPHGIHLTLSKVKDPLHARSLRGHLQNMMAGSVLMALSAPAGSTRMASSATTVSPTANWALSNLALNTLFSSRRPRPKMSPTTLEPSSVPQLPSLALLLHSLPSDAARKMETTLNANEWLR